VRAEIAICLILLGALLPSPAASQELEDNAGFSAVPAVVVDMNDHWKRYRELADIGDQQSADHLSAKITVMRRQAGMLACSSLARGFAMRAWRNQQAGKADTAIKEYRIAVELDPAAMEYRVALAGALAARDPIGFGAYVPIYWEAIWKSFDSLRGRYLLTVDWFLWIGLTLLIAGSLWFLSVLLRFLRSLHHSLTDLMDRVFSRDISALLAIVVMLVPLSFAVELQWIALGLVAVCWAFQSKTGKLLSLLALALIWLGVGMIGLSSDLAAGMTTTEVRTAFIAERYDADEATIYELEHRLKGSVISTDGGLLPRESEKQRMELFLYAEGLRKLGRSRGASGIDVLDAFASLRGSDTLGRLAAVNLGNIQFEREDFVSAQSNYQFALQNPYSKPFALYNLWRLNFERRSRIDARNFWNRLIKEEPEFAERFGITDELRQPVLIDAGPTLRMLDAMVGRGLAYATDSKEIPTFAGLLAKRLFGEGSSWAAIAFAGMLLSYMIFRSIGLAAVCDSCGRVFSKRGDLDPRVSHRCQACNAALAVNVLVDAELRRFQQQKIERCKRVNKIKYIASNIIFPGIGNIWSGELIVGAGLLLVWSALAALLFSINHLPRAIVLPFESHWTFLTGVAALLLALIAYPTSLWLSLKKTKG